MDSVTAGHQRSAIALVALAHLLSDLQQGVLPVLLLYQRQALGMSLGQVGLAAGLNSLALSLSQPLFGHLVDRWGERRIALAAAAWVAVFAGALGLARSVGAVVLLASLSALGPAAFHPAGAAAVGRMNLARRGLATSVFFVGGTAGLALGPIIGGAMFGTIGLRGTVWIALGTLVLAAGVLSVAPLSRQAGPRSVPLRPEARPGRVLQLRHFLWGGIGAVLLLTGLRTAFQLSLATYVPQHLVELGFGQGQASGGLSLMQAAVAGGVLLGGVLADRVGPRSLGLAAMLGLAPVLVLFAQGSGAAANLVLVAAGLLIGLPLSMTLVTGQALLGEARGLASGLVFAASSAAGAGGVAFTGLLADHWGLTTALTALAGLSALAALVSLALPEKKGALSSAQGHA